MLYTNKKQSGPDWGAILSGVGSFLTGLLGEVQKQQSQGVWDEQRKKLVQELSAEIASQRDEIAKELSKEFEKKLMPILLGFGALMLILVILRR